MSEHPLDVLREARDALVVWGTEGIAEVDAALCAVEQLEPVIRRVAGMADDEWPSNTPGNRLALAQLVADARAALALFDRKEQTP